MTAIATDELDKIDEAFAGNRLLSTFPAEARALIEPFGEVVRLKVGDIVQSRGQDVDVTYFPYD